MSRCAGASAAMPGRPDSPNGVSLSSPDAEKASKMAQTGPTIYAHIRTVRAVFSGYGAPDASRCTGTVATFAQSWSWTDRPLLPMTKAPEGRSRSLKSTVVSACDPAASTYRVRCAEPVAVCLQVVAATDLKFLQAN